MSKELVHTKNCRQLHNDVAIARERYELLYPGHCRKCDGAGGFEDPGSYWDPPNFDICSCLEEGRCPQCGRKPWTSYELDDIAGVGLICPNCGWTELHSDVKPDLGNLYPCPCEMDFERKLLEEYHTLEEYHAKKSYPGS